MTPKEISNNKVTSDVQPQWFGIGISSKVPANTREELMRWTNQQATHIPMANGLYKILICPATIAQYSLYVFIYMLPTGENIQWIKDNYLAKLSDAKVGWASFKGGVKEWDKHPLKEEEVYQFAGNFQNTTEFPPIHQFKKLTRYLNGELDQAEATGIEKEIYKTRDNVGGPAVLHRMEKTNDQVITIEQGVGKFSGIDIQAMQLTIDCAYMVGIGYKGDIERTLEKFTERTVDAENNASDLLSNNINIMESVTLVGTPKNISQSIDIPKVVDPLTKQEKYSFIKNDVLQEFNANIDAIILEEAKKQIESKNTSTRKETEIIKDYKKPYVAPAEEYEGDTSRIDEIFSRKRGNEEEQIERIPSEDLIEIQESPQGQQQNTSPVAMPQQQKAPMLQQEVAITVKQKYLRIAASGVLIVNYVCSVYDNGDKEIKGSFPLSSLEKGKSKYNLLNRPLSRTKDQREDTKIQNDYQVLLGLIAPEELGKIAALIFDAVQLLVEADTPPFISISAGYTRIPVETKQQDFIKKWNIFKVFRFGDIDLDEMKSKYNAMWAEENKLVTMETPKKEEDKIKSDLRKKYFSPAGIM